MPSAAARQNIRSNKAPRLSQRRSHNYRMGLAAVGVHALLVRGRESELTWEAQVAEWRALGATPLSLDTMRAGLAQPQDHITMVRQMKQVLDA